LKEHRQAHNAKLNQEETNYLKNLIMQAKSHIERELNDQNPSSESLNSSSSQKQFSDADWVDCQPGETTRTLPRTIYVSSNEPLLKAAQTAELRRKTTRSVSQLQQMDSSSAHSSEDLERIRANFIAQQSLAHLRMSQEQSVKRSPRNSSITSKHLIRHTMLPLSTSRKSDWDGSENFLFASWDKTQ